MHGFQKPHRRQKRKKSDMRFYYLPCEFQPQSQSNCSLKAPQVCLRTIICLPENDYSRTSQVLPLWKRSKKKTIAERKSYKVFIYIYFATCHVEEKCGRSCFAQMRPKLKFLVHVRNSFWDGQLCCCCIFSSIQKAPLTE